MKRFPVVRAKGTHYEVGKAVGEARKEIIVKLFQKNKSLHADYFTSFRKDADELLALTENYFPQYVEELRGLADGAGLDRNELFLSNGHELSYFCDSSTAGHCTIVGIPNNGGYLLGHNEDWNIEALEHLYLLDAKIEGIHILGLGYDFANTIIGDAVAINGFGLIEAINEVSHTDTSIGVPKAFIARAVIDCRSLEDAEKIIQTVPRRSGFNHLLIQGSRLWNIETSAKENVIEKIEQQKYVHTNHYLTELKRIDKGGNPESVLRYEKVKQKLADINSVEDLKNLLSDRSEPPVCRESTIGSVIFNPNEKTAEIAYGQPTVDSYYKITLE